MKKLFYIFLASTALGLTGFFVLYSDSLYDEYYSEASNTSISKNHTSKGYINSIEPSAVEGFDWSLPKTTKPELYSGLIDENSDSAANEFVIIRWDSTNPRYRKYDFSRFSKKLKKIFPARVLVRLEVNSACEAPSWALQKLRSSKDKSLIFWDDSYLELLQLYIHEFGKKFANNPQIIGVQLGIADGEYKGDCSDNDNKDGWGEFWMSPQELAEAEDDFGLTPRLFLEKTKQIIDIYTSAFKGNEGKLAFTNLDPFFSWDDISTKYDEKMSQISDYVLEKGLGDRDGNIEAWMRYISKSYGIKHLQNKNGTCSLIIDESFAKSIEGRYWGTENEFYGNDSYIIDYGGPLKNQPYRFMISSLRALQMRRNFMTINSDGMKKIGDSIYKTSDFVQYLKNTLGKTIENTSDVFLLLGERYIRSDIFLGVSEAEKACIKNNKVTVSSFGRWLSIMSDSQAAEKVMMPKEESYWGQDIYLPSGYDYEYSARSSSVFKFNISDELIRKRCKSKCSVEIKITIKDENKTNIWVETVEGRSMIFKAKGDKKIKTITFPVQSEFKPLNAPDFVIRTDGVPITAMLIRVNFL